MKLRSLVLVGGVLASMAAPGAAVAGLHDRPGPPPYRSEHRLRHLHHGAARRVQFCSHRWCKVKLSSYTGWMSSGHITGSQPRYSRYRAGVEARARPQRPQVYQPNRSYRPASDYSIDLSLGSRSWR